MQVDMQTVQGYMVLDRCTRTQHGVRHTHAGCQVKGVVVLTVVVAVGDHNQS